MSRSFLALLILVALVTLSSTAPATAPGGGGLPPPPPNGDPGTWVDTGPAMPSDFKVANRDVKAETTGPCAGPAGSVCVSWLNNTGATTVTLQHSTTGNAPWGNVAVTSSLTGGVLNYMRHIGASADALHCYRLALTNSSGTNVGPVKCAYTRDHQDRALWRARVRLRTATSDGASSDAHVQVRLQPPAGFDLALPTGNETWIDTPIDDFAGGSNVWYELSTKGLGDISDVTQLTIDLQGSDNLCLRAVELELNEERAFLLDNGAGPCSNVTDGTNFFVNHDPLRASANWQNLGPEDLPLDVDYAWLDAIVTSAVGDAIHGYDVQLEAPSYGHPNPAVWTTDPHRRHYEFSFWYIWHKLTLPVSVSFDLVASTVCDLPTGQPKGVINVENIDADVDQWLVLLWPITEGILESHEPLWPQIMTSANLPGTCGPQTPSAIKLCFGPTALEPGICAD